MILSDISVKRPVFAGVLSLLLIAFGIVAFDRLPLREYPDIDPPIVSIDTDYIGASANVVESRITELLEERIAGVQGIRFVESSSEDGRSRITVEFNINRDIDAAANDIRDRISGILNNLPEEADPPEIQKEDSNSDVIMWLNLTGENMTVPELTDYAERYLVERFSILNGVSRVRIGGQEQYAMRIWLDRKLLAAKNITVSDVEKALRDENVELPAGIIESDQRQFTVRTKRAFKTPQEFSNLVVAQQNVAGRDYLVRLGDVARVEFSTLESRTFFRGNRIPQVGIGIIKQSTANTIDVTTAAKKEADRIRATLPSNIKIEQSYDTSIFIRGAITEVYRTLGIAILLVALVILLFLGNMRSMLIPTLTVPVSLIATFLALYLFGFSINLLTLLALVLSIGLVVDDSIVVLENISRRIKDNQETPLLASFYGTRQVAFAVIATTVVLVSVFVPIAFQQGDVGRLFSEFALTMAAAVMFSSFIALTLTPMLASKLLKESTSQNHFVITFEKYFNQLQLGYVGLLKKSLKFPLIGGVLFVLFFATGVYLFSEVPQEYAPKEDRGAFFVIVNGPEGASYSFIKEYMDEIEDRLMPYVESEEVTRLLVRAPRSFGRTQTFSTGIVIILLNDWGKRRSGFEIIQEVRKKLSDLPGVRAFPVMRQGFGSAISKPVSFVIGGGTYSELAQWRNVINEKLNENNPGLLGVEWDYKETKPQVEVEIDYNRASTLGVKIGDIGATLETMFGSRRVTTFINEGEEYDVVLEGERDQQRSTTSLQNIYVRSEINGNLIPLSNVVSLKEFADSNRLNRYNRIRAITLTANLEEGFTLGQGLSHLELLVKEHLPSHAVIDYKGQSRDFKFAGESVIFIFLLGLFVTYLVLAAQFESWVHPFIIMLSVPMAMAGGLLGLYLTGSSLNLYSQIGLVMLVGLSAKNGILIVEFANQLRDQGREFFSALIDASLTRFRPIVMTAVTTVAGSIPLIYSSGAGSETREVIGIVVFYGVILSTIFTLFIVPIAYNLIARNTQSPNHIQKILQKYEVAKK